MSTTATKCTCPLNRMTNKKEPSFYCDREDHRKIAAGTGRIDGFSAKRTPDDE